MIGIFLPWFEFGSTLTGYFSFASTALRSWMYLTFFSALAVVCLLVLERIVPGFRPPLEHWLVFLACTANLLLTAVCFAKKAAGLDWDTGAYLSLVAATVAPFGALVRRSRPATNVSGP
jgi:drug/metabolite transporter (DMT)-like permease